ncbi:MAG: hypothetical protein AAF340_00495 [Pseudomonadota bacterium]
MRKRIFSIFCGVFLAIGSGAVQAMTFQCSVVPTKTGGQNAAISPTVKVVFDNGDLIISDDFIRAAGKRAVRGKYDRRVKDDILFSWTVHGVPNQLMPRENTAYYPQVIYRGRLDVEELEIKISADFVSRKISGGSSGKGMRGVGRCKKIEGSYD